MLVHRTHAGDHLTVVVAVLERAFEVIDDGKPEREDPGLFVEGCVRQEPLVSLADVVEVGERARSSLGSESSGGRASAGTSPDDGAFESPIPLSSP